ncbi:MAG: glycosyltransferase family 2 protein [Anaerolineae bacterium]
MNDELRSSLAVSVVIPAYNEAEGLSPFLDEIEEVMRESDFVHEIIVVDDGSSDGTGQVAERQGARVIRHPFNKGYGAALKTGIRRARYDLVAIIDADGTYPGRDIPRLLRHLVGRDYDMVVGARSGQNVPFLRRPAKWVLTCLANYLAGLNIPDLNSGLRVFKKEVALEFLHLLPSGFSFTASITLALLSNDYLVDFVPVDYYRRRGRSKIRPLRDTLNFLGLIVRTVMYFQPLKVFMPIGLLFVLGGLVRGGYGALAFHNITTADVLLLVTGALIAMLGLLADLINKRVGSVE